jgi:hypothetical protein
MGSASAVLRKRLREILPGSKLIPEAFLSAGAASKRANGDNDASKIPFFKKSRLFILLSPLKLLFAAQLDQFPAQGNHRLNRVINLHDGLFHGAESVTFTIQDFRYEQCAAVSDFMLFEQVTGSFAHDFGVNVFYFAANRDGGGGFADDFIDDDGIFHIAFAGIIYGKQR